MQTLKQEEEHVSLIAKTTADLMQNWRSRLLFDLPNQSAASRECIIRWLLGKDLERFERVNPQQLERVEQAMAYRYCILRGYLGEGPQTYHQLMTRLLRIVPRSKIRFWVAHSRDRRRTVVDVLQEVIQELLQSDRYVQQQMAWIAEYTEARSKLRIALLFASIEEYCLRPIRNQPLLVYRFINYLRRSQRGGLSQVAAHESIQLVSEEILTHDTEDSIHLSDRQAVAQYRNTQVMEEQQALRTAVKEEFERYLASRLGLVAVQWFQLYLQGRSQPAIARSLNLSIQEVYRLREKVSYHALRVFALRSQSELVGTWLEILLQEHSLGLTPQEWQQFWENLTARQRQLIQLLKAGKNIEAIALALNLKTHQVMGEWSKCYLAAKALRT